MILFQLLGIATHFLNWLQINSICRRPRLCIWLLEHGLGNQFRGLRSREAGSSG
jgi:hypothetical protein